MQQQQQQVEATPFEFSVVWNACKHQRTHPTKRVQELIL